MKTKLGKTWTIQRKLELIALVYVISVAGNLLVSIGGVLVYLRPAFFRAVVASEARARVDQCRARMRGLDRMRGSASADAIQTELVRIANELDGGASADTVSSAGRHLNDLQRALADLATGASEFGMARLASIDSLFSQAADDLEVERRTSLERAGRVQERVIAVAVFNSGASIILLLIGLRSVHRWLVQPVNQLRSATEDIGRGNFDVEIVLPYRDEMAVLGERIQHMAARIAGMQALLLDRERRLAATETIEQVDDALRSQLARIRELVRSGLETGAGDRDTESCHCRMLDTLQRLESWLLDLQRSFAPEAPVLQPIALKDLLASVHQSLQEALERHQVKLDVRVDRGLPPVELDRIQFEHSLIALITNAAEASRPGQRVRVQASGAQGRPDAWELVVEDEGAGIPRDVQQRLFTPFLTTKPDGNGIGLALARSVIEAHGGKISCVSEPGRGTRFTVVMPVRKMLSG